MQAHLAAKDKARSEAMDQGYRQSANAVGLMSIPGVRDERKMIAEIERERTRTEVPATAEQKTQFFVRSLRPQGRSRRR